MNETAVPRTAPDDSARHDAPASADVPAEPGAALAGLAVTLTMPLLWQGDQG